MQKVVLTLVKCADKSFKDFPSLNGIPVIQIVSKPIKIRFLVNCVKRIFEDLELMKDIHVESKPKKTETRKDMGDFFCFATKKLP